jgi:hypothetical protein
VSREFAREHSDRLWKQLVLHRDAGGDDGAPSRGSLRAAILCAVAAAVAVKLPALVGIDVAEDPGFYLRNAGLFVLPILAAYFAWERRLLRRGVTILAAVFTLAALVANLYPVAPGGSSELLIALHLPVALWFAVGYAYVGGEWRSPERRMDLVRFTGEWVVYYALIALGGGVLLGLTMAAFGAIGVDLDTVAGEWLLPCGAVGAVVVAAWLVEAKQRIVENMAPVLTLLFTPLFAVVLAGSAVVYAVTAPGGTFDRELLGVFNALMVVVLGLVLYGMSARGPAQPPGWMDRTQVVAVVSALVLDVMVLASLAARISDLGWTPNRAAALGLNLVLLVDLAGSAWLSVRFLRGRGTFHRLERWQTTYLPVFPAWAATVVVVFPPAFGFS